MTEVVFATLNAVNTNTNPANQETDSSTNQIVDLAAERLRLVRKTIANARPVLPDDISRKAKVMAAKKIWNEGKPVKHSMVEQYLGTYEVESKPENFARLRYHPAVLHEPTRRYYPAMVAPVYDFDDNFVGIHRTYLLPDGSGRARVPTGEDRRMLGDCFGSYIQLRPVNGFRLVITESIEAALVVQQSCRELPVWASMTIGNLKSPVPAGVKEIIFCTDEDHKKTSVADKLIKDAVRAQMSRGVTMLKAEPLPGFRLKDMRLR